jgi:hypothetical protein
VNHPPDVEPVLRAYLAGIGDRAPDRVLVDVAARIARQPRRRTWRLHWRLPMTTQLKLVAGLAAVLVLAVVGYNLLPKLGVGDPGPTPTVAPTPTAPAASTPVPTCDTAQSCAMGTLKGAIRTTLFDPAFAFTVPPGPADGPPAAYWQNPFQWIDLYEIDPPSGALSFAVHSIVAIPEQNADCTHVMKAGAGKGVADWIDFLTTHPGLDTSTPVAVTLPGATGFSIDFVRSPSWTATCPNSVGPAVVTLTDDNGAQGKVYWTDDQRVTWTILDVAGKTVIITLDSASSDAAHRASLAIVDPIIQSFDFTP